MRAKEILKEEVKKYPTGYLFRFREKISPKKFAKLFWEYREYEHNCRASFRELLEERIYEEGNLGIQEEQEARLLFGLHHTPAERDTVFDYIGNGELLSALRAEGFAGFRYDIDSAIGEYRINIILKGGNCCQVTDPEFVRELAKKDTIANGLLYILYQQGYTMKDLVNVTIRERDSESRFVKTLAAVMAGADDPCHVTALAMVDRGNLSALDGLVDGYVTLPPNTFIGLFNNWYRDGDVFGIRLETPLILPSELVKDVQFEETGAKEHGYTVADAYGTLRVSWNSRVVASDCPYSVNTFQRDIRNSARNTARYIRRSG